ncbi:MAG: 1-acyl-sn-glycerol-3-phosphate acyltransferase [Clostridia bacterium]|nr:1-acyl-sn-glycerol-3-phosphate acyltransferase [Clostridia bacterium]
MMKKQAKSLTPDRIAVLERIREYETRGGEWFFENAEEDPPSRTLTPEDVDYLRKTAKFRVNGFFARLAERAAFPFFRRKYGMTLAGAEHLASLTGGAVFTSNHFDRFESLAVRYAASRAPGKHRLWKLIREGNYFIPGILGWFLRYADTLPLSSSVKTMGLLERAVGEILARGDFLLVYPEQAMWWNYKKPRPYRIGAFHFAAKNGVPVVPCFVTLREKDPALPLLPDNVAYTVHVGEPIFPDPALSVRENAEAMRKENAAFARAVYEKTYGEPLCYLCGEDPFAAGREKA